MSNKALNHAWAAQIPAGPKFVLVALADHGADHDGEDWSCFPSPERLMDFTGFPLRTLERHLTWLDLKGWITRISMRDARGRKGKVTYRLHRTPKPKPGHEKLDKSEACPPPPPANMAGGEAAPPPAKNGAGQPPKSAAPAANMAGGLYIAEPPINPQEPPTVRARALARWLWTLWPDAGKRGVSSLRQVEAALLAEIVKPEWSEAAFKGGARAYVADRLVWGASGKPKAAHNWVLLARWEGFDLELGGETAALAAKGWTGPAEVRAVVLACGVAAWAIDQAGWDEAAQAVVAATGFAARALRQGAGHRLAAMSVTVRDPAAAPVEA